VKNSKQAWEQEYAEKRLMTGDKPAKSFLRWTKWMSKQHKVEEDREISWRTDFWNKKWILDLGSGEGKNAFYLAGLGAKVNCVEIAQNAVETTKNRAIQANLDDIVTVQQGSIGEKYNFTDNSFDAVIDVTSSNSLSERERAVYLSESARVLKPGGHVFVRALCKDGDDNAKYLIKNNPGPEKDTYVQPEWGLTERVFTESDIRELYGQYFEVLKLEKETHYTKLDGKKFKRNFWVMYLKNKTN